MVHSKLTQEAAGGLAAGIVGTVIGFPLDTIKARQQVLNQSGIRQTATTIFRQEGILAFYRGLVPPLLSLSLLNTLNFTLYASIQNYLDAPRGWHWKNALAGAIVGPISSCVSTVENVIKTQVQLDNVTAKRFTGSLDCLRMITRENGISVLYTGHLVNTSREIVFIATYFGFYEGIRENLAHWHHASNDTKWNQWAIPAAGGLAGAIAWATSFPLDCVRAGVQGQEFSANTAKKSAMKVFSDLLASRGIRGLYAGVAPSIVRAFLVSASRFSAYESALWLLRGGRDKTT
jgi:solute carrier family 25 carnitine/acylcarnitine transporter 20/29